MWADSQAEFGLGGHKRCHTKQKIIIRLSVAQSGVRRPPIIELRGCLVKMCFLVSTSDLLNPNLPSGLTWNLLTSSFDLPVAQMWKPQSSLSFYSKGNRNTPQKGEGSLCRTLMSCGGCGLTVPRCHHCACHLRLPRDLLHLTGRCAVFYCVSFSRKLSLTILHMRQKPSGHQVYLNYQ